jgi:hypothetical protein
MDTNKYKDWISLTGQAEQMDSTLQWNDRRGRDGLLRRKNSSQ